MSLRPMCAGMKMSVLAYEPLVAACCRQNTSRCRAFPSRICVVATTALPELASVTANKSRPIWRESAKRSGSRCGYRDRLGSRTAEVTAVIAGAKSPKHIEQNVLAHRVIDQERLLTVIGKVANTRWVVGPIPRLPLPVSTNPIHQSYRRLPPLFAP